MRRRPRGPLEHLGRHDTNSWFPITLSALAIPQTKYPLSQLIQDGREFFEELESKTEVSVMVKTLKKTGALPGIDKYARRSSGLPSKRTAQAGCRKSLVRRTSRARNAMF